MNLKEIKKKMIISNKIDQARRWISLLHFDRARNLLIDVLNTDKDNSEAKFYMYYMELYEIKPHRDNLDENQVKSLDVLISNLEELKEKDSIKIKKNRESKVYLDLGVAIYIKLRHEILSRNPKLPEDLRYKIRVIEHTTPEQLGMVSKIREYLTLSKSIDPENQKYCDPILQKLKLDN